MGPGLLESVYQECLVSEFGATSLRFATEVRVPLAYKGQRLRSSLKVDLLVEDCVIVEVKAVEALHPIFAAQLITYLKLTDCPAGLLINFNAILLNNGLRRVDHPDRYAARRRT